MYYRGYHRLPLDGAVIGTFWILLRMFWLNHNCVLSRFLEQENHCWCFPMFSIQSTMSVSQSPLLNNCQRSFAGSEIYDPVLPRGIFGNFGGCSKSSRQLQLLITDGPCLPPLSWFWTLQDNTSQKKFGHLVLYCDFTAFSTLVERCIIGRDGESRILFIGARQRDYFDGQAHCNAVSQCFLGNVTVVPEFGQREGTGVSWL